MLIVALIVATLAHAAFGWWGVAVVAAFVLAAIFGKDPPTEPTSPRRKRKGLHLNDDPNPWYMQSPYRFGLGNGAPHNHWHKKPVAQPLKGVPIRTFVANNQSGGIGHAMLTDRKSTRLKPRLYLPTRIITSV